MPLSRISGQLSDERLIDADQYIFRFDVCVYDTALGVQIVQSFQNLPDNKSNPIRQTCLKKKTKNKRRKINGWLATNLADDGLDVEQRNALILAADDKLEKIVTQDLEHHADVSAVDAADLEIVQQLDRLLAFRVRFVALADAAQQFDLVQRRFRVVRRALDNLERYEPFGSVVAESKKRKEKQL